MSLRARLSPGRGATGAPASRREDRAVAGGPLRDRARASVLQLRPALAGATDFAEQDVGGQLLELDPCRELLLVAAADFDASTDIGKSRRLLDLVVVDDDLPEAQLAVGRERRAHEEVPDEADRHRRGPTVVDG